MKTARPLLLLALLLLCAGCSGARYATRWDGRRGYDGNGDYGYDLAASRAEARSYRAQAASSYPAPGTPDDPWGPYVQEAAARYQVPERWIRAVMRQESGGRQFDSNGMLVISSAGAMGLMQVMPRTYETLRQHYGLGSDPYEPRNNILAGTAYIREMYDRYGSPAFLAAYNAGPDNLDAYLTGGSPLPDETVNYLASVAPRLGTEVAMTGPLAVYAGRGGFRLAATADADRAYAGGGMVATQYQAASETDGDPSDRAYEGGGLVTASAPTGMLTGQPAPPLLTAPMAAPMAAPVAAPVDAPMVAQAVAPAFAAGVVQAVAPVVATPLPVANTAPPYRQPVMASPRPIRTVRGNWGIQVGAYPNPETSRNVIAAARSRATALLAGAEPAITPVQRGGVLFRARLVGLSPENASAACTTLSDQGIDCFTVPPGS